ncbi:hypothetical protein SAMN05421812_112213 [Asanoa hainanensis]|uniref:Uncharacterized protein n=1 Tax=Asanoa hainanensis TaxID=560556 RepID=A0A239P2F6_9ACTN|nr:hypothetical protein [Asanoa hainanensis]SNT60834.1 hypothetical protein SAMN05421812_112213 [Asanoa hainanensis]
MHRTALLTQSMLFLAGAAASLWFLGSLRSHLVRFERGPGQLSTVAFGAGIAWVAVNLVAQAFQIGLANDPGGEASVALIEATAALFTVANLPLAMMLAAAGIVSLHHRAFPVWVGWH